MGVRLGDPNADNRRSGLVPCQVRDQGSTHVTRASPRWKSGVSCPKSWSRDGLIDSDDSYAVARRPNLRNEDRLRSTGNVTRPRANLAARERTDPVSSWPN